MKDLFFFHWKSENNPIKKSDNLDSFSALISPGIRYRNAFKLISFCRKEQKSEFPVCISRKTFFSSLPFIFKTNYTRKTRERLRAREAKINDRQNHVLSTTSFVPIAELLFIIFSQSLIPIRRYLKQMYFLHPKANIFCVRWTYKFKPRDDRYTNTYKKKYAFRNPSTSVNFA